MEKLIFIETLSFFKGILVRLHKNYRIVLNKSNNKRKKINNWFTGTKYVIYIQKIINRIRENVTY